MKSIFFLIFLLLQFLFVSGQKRHHKIIPQFSYNQIDSLVENSVNSILNRDSSAFIVVSTIWYEGAQVRSRGRFAYYDNRFETHILYTQGNNFYIQEIDNFGYFKRRRSNDKLVKKFIDTFFRAMAKEELRPKIDTNYGDKGNMTISCTITDDEIIRYVLVYSHNEQLRYSYPEYFSVNEQNLNTYQYKFFKIIDKPIEIFKKKKRKRVSVAWGESEI